MKKALFISSAIVVLLVGCHPEENPEQLKAVNQSLEYANGVMQEANNVIYEEFSKMKTDLSTAVMAVVWEPKAKPIGLYSDSVRAFIKTTSVGLVAFYSASNETISVNGKQVLLNNNGSVEYSFIPTGKPGKYSVPLMVEFTDPYGTKDTVKRNLEYIIAEN